MMRQTATHIIMALLALVALSGCSHNNGDIGLWFGQWNLDTVEVDGEPDAAYDGQFYFMFQNKVFCVRHVDEVFHAYFESYATWQESDNGKTITITFVDNRYSPRVHDQVPDIYLNTITIMNVVSLNTTSMTLSHTNDSGKTITYHLTKWK